MFAANAFAWPQFAQGYALAGTGSLTVTLTDSGVLLLVEDAVTPSLDVASAVVVISADDSEWFPLQPDSGQLGLSGDIGQWFPVQADTGSLDLDSGFLEWFPAQPESGRLILTTNDGQSFPLLLQSDDTRRVVLTADDGQTFPVYPDTGQVQLRAAALDTFPLDALSGVLSLNSDAATAAHDIAIRLSASGILRLKADTTTVTPETEEPTGTVSLGATV